MPSPFQWGLSGFAQGLPQGLNTGIQQGMQQQQLDVAKYGQSIKTLGDIMSISLDYPEIAQPLLKGWKTQNEKLGNVIDPTFGDVVAKFPDQLKRDVAPLLAGQPQEIAQMVAADPRMKAQLLRDPAGFLAKVLPLAKEMENRRQAQQFQGSLAPPHPTDYFPVGGQAPALAQATMYENKIADIQKNMASVDRPIGRDLRTLLETTITQHQAAADKSRNQAFWDAYPGRVQQNVEKGMSIDEAQSNAVTGLTSELKLKGPPTGAPPIGLKLEKPPTSQSEEQLTQAALYDPDPTKRSQASGILNAMQARKLEIVARSAGATEEAKMTAQKQEAIAVIKQSGLVQRLLDGRTAPDDISQSFRQPWVRILAVGEAMKQDPNYNEIQADANKKWYASPTTQRLIRRTESIVAPGGAADEAIRFANLVDNPAGTPINALTGRAKVMFGNSQRSLLSLVHGISSEEIQQIMGAQGGGERFLEFTNQLNDPNLSVDQYVNNVKELKYLIYTRQAANVRGTPEQKTWEKLGAGFTAQRPFSPPPPPGGIVPGMGEGGARGPGGGPTTAMDFLKKYNVTPGRP